MLRLASVLVSLVLLAASAERAVAQDGGSQVNFRFENADIRLVIKTVGEQLGRRFVVDDSVSGRVTLVTPGVIPAAEAYPLFVTLLQSAGYTVAQRENALHIVPLAAREIPEAPVIGPEQPTVAEGLVTKILALRHVNVLELKKMLDPLVAGGAKGALAAFPSTNHLLITDTAESVRRLERIVEELDRPGASRSIEVIRLQHASAQELAQQLSAAISGAESAGDRLNRRLAQVSQGGASLPAESLLLAIPQANSLVAAGTPPQLAEIRRIVEQLDTEPFPGSGRLQAYFLKYLSAENAAKSLSALLARRAGKDQPSELPIEPDTANNALIVDASPRDFEFIRSLLDQLDQMPQQVLVEVFIAEVTMAKGFELGVEWATIDTPESGRNTFVGRSRPGEVDLTRGTATDGIFPQGLTLALAKGTFTDPITGVTMPSVPVFLRALAQNRNVRILSNVPLMAQNNHEASVSVVENIPILRSTIEGGSGTARDVIQNIDRVDVGIKLVMTPHVNPDREITLTLNPSIEAIVDEGPAGQFSPTIAKREVSTKVTIPDRSTVAISGLIREDEIDTVRKVPLLGDIPLLGALFRSTTKSRQKTNLLIFVTPHIVTDEEQAAKLREAIEGRTGLGGAAQSMRIEATPSELE